MIEDLLDQREATAVRDLLEDDQVLFDYTTEQITDTQQEIQGIVSACKIIKELRSSIPRLSPIPVSSLYTRAATGDLEKSPLIRDFLLAVKKAPSDILSNLLSVLTSSDASDETTTRLQADLAKLVRSTGAPNQPLRSAHDVRHETLRTTIVAQKVELSKQKSAISATDAAYSKLVEELHGWLEGYFERVLIRPQDLYLHEVVMYDLKSPNRDVFTPKPRAAVERALSAPHDYLNCSCCDVSKGAEVRLFERSGFVRSES